MKSFILILRENFEVALNLSESERMALIRAHQNWRQELSSKGVFKAGDGFERTGSIISGNNRMLIDGPNKVENGGELRGYYIILAKDQSEAIEIAKGCPTLDHNGSVEIRPIMNYES